jgi:hypothetical protein
LPKETELLKEIDKDLERLYPTGCDDYFEEKVLENDFPRP